MFLSFTPIYMPKIKVRYLSISEILTIKEYWNFIDREQFLAITWEPDISQTCSFRRMSVNHKNFRFTQIPDETNDMIFLKSLLRQMSKIKGSICSIFLKSPKTLSWAIFGHFCPMRIFSKKSGSVTRNHIWTPNTILSFRKN